jgi:SAM-dependent methyltransferase
MKRELLALLACPECGENLGLTHTTEVDGEIQSGRLICQDCSRQFPIVNAIPRFVSDENYAGGFGLQWNRYRRTQLDSYSGLPISRERFFRQSGWKPEDLHGRRVLDVGCGAGRFAEIVLTCGADLVALDYSSAVDACWQNHFRQPGLNVVQGDIYHLPFKPGRFDFVYCFGVLQHTPDVRQAFMALPLQLRAGGQLAVDVYPVLPLNFLWPKYWLRPLTRRIPPVRLFAWVRTWVEVLLPLSRLIGRLPGIGRKLRYLIPVANYEGVYSLSEAQLREWAVLDTFDMFAPAYDQPQSAPTLRAWFQAARLQSIEVFRSGFLVGRGVK